MTFPVTLLILLLGVLTVLQRVLPWLIYRRFRSGARSQKFFDIVAVAAFSSLMVYNVNSLDFQNVLPLVPALIVAYRTRNIGLSIIVAMIFALVLTLF